MHGQLGGLAVAHLQCPNRTQGQVAHDGQVRKEVETLENHAHLATNLVKTVPVGAQCHAINNDLSLLVHFQPVDASYQGRLAGTRRTADHDPLTAVHMKINVLESLKAVKEFRYPREPDDFVPSGGVHEHVTCLKIRLRDDSATSPEPEHVIRLCIILEAIMKLLKTCAVLLVMAAMAVSANAQSALNDILNNGVLKVGTTGDWNPMTVKDPATNSYAGYDIDVMTELAKDLGVELEFVPTDWKTLVNGVTAGTYHLTGSASISPSRAKAAGYSHSYFRVATVPLIHSRHEGNIMEWEDLDKADMVVAATLGTTQEQQVKMFFPNAQHKIVEAPARDFQEVLAGRADAHITSNVEAATLVSKYDELKIVPVSTPRARTPIAMLLPQDDQVWINYVNTWITLKKERGFFEALGQKWGLAN